MALSTPLTSTSRADKITFRCVIMAYNIMTESVRLRNKNLPLYSFLPAVMRNLIQNSGRDNTTTYEEFTFGKDRFNASLEFGALQNPSASLKLTTPAMVFDPFQPPEFHNPRFRLAPEEIARLDVGFEEYNEYAVYPQFNGPVILVTPTVVVRPEFEGVGIAHSFASVAIDLIEKADEIYKEVMGHKGMTIRVTDLARATSKGKNHERLSGWLAKQYGFKLDYSIGAWDKKIR